VWCHTLFIRRSAVGDVDVTDPVVNRRKAGACLAAPPGPQWGSSAVAAG